MELALGQRLNIQLLLVDLSCERILPTDQPAAGFLQYRGSLAHVLQVVLTGQVAHLGLRHQTRPVDDSFGGNTTHDACVRSCFANSQIVGVEVLRNIPRNRRAAGGVPSAIPDHAGLIFCFRLSARRAGSGGDRTGTNQSIRRFQLITGHGTGEEIHRPARVKQHWSRTVNAMKQEHAFPQTRNQVVNGLNIGAARSGGETVHETLFIEAGLQAADHPCASVGKRFVIQVQRVLSGDHQTNPKRAGLFEHAQ